MWFEGFRTGKNASIDRRRMTMTNEELRKYYFGAYFFEETKEKFVKGYLFYNSSTM